MAETIYRVVAPRRGKNPAGACAVYIMENEAGILKIGVSNNPGSRLSGVRTGSAEGVELRHTWLLETRDMARSLEGAMHRLLKPRRKSGEWYRVKLHQARSVGDALIRGDATVADLADCVVGLNDENDLVFELTDKLKGLHWRWGAHERREIEGEIEDAEMTYAGWSERGKRLGMLPSPLEEWRMSRDAKRSA